MMMAKAKKDKVVLEVQSSNQVENLDTGKSMVAGPFEREMKAKKKVNNMYEGV